VKHELRRTTLILIILLIALFSALPIAYGVYPPIRPAVNSFFGAVIPSVTVWATNTWAWFITLPYWPLLLFVGGSLLGIMLDRWAWKTLISFRQRMVGAAIRDSGLAPRQSRPVVQQTTPPTPTPQTPVEDTAVLQTTELDQT
jgi:hypothetical protein